MRDGSRQSRTPTFPTSKTTRRSPSVRRRGEACAEIGKGLLRQAEHDQHWFLSLKAAIEPRGLAKTSRLLNMRTDLQGAPRSSASRVHRRGGRKADVVFRLALP
jgi:hypothetical protein